jgi:alpha-tubulin suppressor-like RCC1 family protein
MKKLYVLLFVVLAYTQINAQCWRSVNAGGSNRTLAIRTDGSLWAWGHNGYGQLGDDTTITKNKPTQIGTATDWQTVAIGLYHSVALKTDGTLWTWGLNQWGQLGDNTTIDKHTPTQIGIATDWRFIATGTYHTLALKTDGTLWAWGANFDGRLGDGTNIDKYTPTQIGTGTWQSIAAGISHSAAIKTGGTLWTWGGNFQGQLGDGTKVDKNAPIQIGTDANWRFIATSGYHNAAIRTDGILWSWGQNSFGQLGDNTLTDRLAPIQIGTATDWQSVSTGVSHSVALKNNGTFWAWGRNNEGQYGNGGFGFNKFVPTQVGTATDWQSISAGVDHTAFLKTDGTLWTSGSNFQGQIGNGTNTNVNIPTQVSCVALGTEEFAAKNKPFSIYPNPAKETLYLLNTTNKSIDKIVVSDLTGKKVLEQNGNSSQVNTQELRQGMYLLQVFSEGKSYMDKFIKE